MFIRKLQLYRIPILFVLSLLAFYFVFAYNLDRTDFFRLAGLYLASFYISFKLIQMQKHDFWFLAGAALLLRLMFLFSLPELSQDYFRFIWDGNLMLKGINPFRFTAEELMGQSTFSMPRAAELFQGMGSLSAGNYSNYPPLSQLVYVISAFLGSKSILGSVIIIRLILIFADIGTLFFGRKLLKQIKLPEYRIFWFILNPFVIIELVGNLHLEGIMVFFLIFAIYLLQTKKWIGSSIFMAFSILVKLLPLVLLPILIKKLIRDFGMKKMVLYYLLLGTVIVLGFSPFYSAMIFSNFSESIGLWFQKFEWNASIYYVVRWIGFQVKGYNIIETAGIALSIVTFLLIFILAFLRNVKSERAMITSMLFAVTIYLLFSTTLHPWYLAIPLALSVFTEYRYVIIWSAVGILSYFAYSQPNFQENLWVIAVEYVLVLGYFILEFGNKKRPFQKILT